MSEVEALAADLARAVELTMDPNASDGDRRKAYSACEGFKDTSPLCAQVGLYLASSMQNLLVVRHFGLQLMEHTVKYRWTQISQPEKLYIKENAMKLLSTGSVNAESHMKDALSRVIVEMVKREWPQQWPTLLNELSDACAYGEIQTEVVLLVFLRLVEDVAVLQTLESNQRRKDIYQALTTNMAIIFAFFLKLIELHVSKFKSFCDENNLAKAAASGRVVEVVLLTLTGFFEWVSINHIITQNGRLIQILCLLLVGNSSFRCPAAECLLQIVNRKGKLEERKPLLILFSHETMNCLVMAAKTPIVITEDRDYLFRKKLVQILCGLSAQLNGFWTKDSNGAPISTFSNYLDAVLQFSGHPSLMLAHMANPIWNGMLKHDQISRDPVFLSYLSEWVKVTAPKLVKSNFSTENSGANDPMYYCKQDFDSEEEYYAFFYRCRSDLLDTFRQATVTTPLVTFSYVEQWLLKCLQVPNATFGLSPNDALCQEWDALSSCLDSVLSRILQAQDSRPSIPAGLQLLQLCLRYQPADPLILSSLLTCISALFVFLSMSSGQIAPSANSIALSGATLLPQVLDKIFSTLIYNPPNLPTNAPPLKAVKNVRRHAASLMVKIGHKYPLLLLPLFDQIKMTVSNLSHLQSGALLNSVEKTTLQEGLLLISNHFCDYDRQSAFISEVMGLSSGLWYAMVSEGVFKGVREFTRFVGMDRPPEDEGKFWENRRNLFFCVNLLLGVVKRCSAPEDPEKATRGGFVVGVTESGNPICRNPAAPHIIPLLPHVLSLIRIFNECYTVEARGFINPAYYDVFSISEAEKNNLLNIPESASDKNQPKENSSKSVDNMRKFLTALHESLYHTVGSIGCALGRDFYGLPDLGSAIINSVLACLDFVPDHKLRPIVRVFLKAFIYSCPQLYYETVLLPVLGHLAPIILSKLTSKWQRVAAIHSRDADDDNAGTEEVLEDIVTRALTREALEVLKVALVGGSLTPEPSHDVMETDDVVGGGADGGGGGTAAIAATTTTTTSHARNNLASEVISELGTLLLRSEQTCQPLVLVVLGSVSWIDSTASLKATYLIGPIVRQLMADHSLNGDMAVHIVAAILNSLTIHGQHEANQGSLLTLGAQMYEILRPAFPEVLGVMQQIPGVNLVDLQKLDERISGNTSKGNKVEKAKKDLFKKITQSLMGKSVGQLFKKEVKIQDLPTLGVAKKADHKVVVPDLRKIFNS